MTKLKKEATLFSRDEDGNLIPKEVALAIDENDPEQEKYKGITVSIIPMMRGEIRKTISELNKKDVKESDLDGELILRYCVDPAYEEKDIAALKPLETSIIVNTIFRESGLDWGKTKKKAIEDKEDEFAKN